jgi:galactokinase
VSSAYGDRRRECEAAARSLGVDSLRDVGDVDDLGRLHDPTVSRRARHVVTEIARVADVADLLDEGRVDEIGPALTASHASLRDDFEVSAPELDAAVDAAVASGALGARMTGGGFGGCAIALCRAVDARVVQEAVERAYREQGWDPPTTWSVAPSAGARKIS